MAETETVEKGVRCTGCGCADLPVDRTTDLPNGRIRRKRHCRNCGRQIITYEAAAGQKVDPPALEDLTPEQRQKLLDRLLGFFGIGRH